MIHQTQTKLNNKLNPNGTLAQNHEVMFTVFKTGVTMSGPVDILNKKGEAYDLVKKVNFYKSLGYTVTNIK